MRYRYTKQPDGSLRRSAQVLTADEHKINPKDVDPLAVHICNKLNAAGYETYIVGGAVRDLLLNKIPKDFDIASAATPAKIKKMFSNSRIIGKRFRLVHVFFGEKIFEIATFRSTENGVDGNTFGRIEEDVLRRDFTLNALFYDPGKELIIDFVGGFQDIHKKRVKPIIPVNIIFEDDPVRMVRAVKYAALSGFKLPLFLKQKIKKSARLLTHISPSRLTEELSKIIKSACAAQIINDLDKLELYAYLQPQASRLFKTLPGYKNRYLTSFETMPAQAAAHSVPPESRAGTLACGLKSLVCDYIDDNLDWSAATEASYKSIFILARKFVLPINPPRVELGRALRDIFADHDIKVRNWRFFDRIP